MKPHSMSRAHFGAPFVLVGVDCDGETREFGYSTIEKARETAANCSRTDASGPAWQSWAIWGNDPITEEWKVLEASKPCDGFP